MDNNIPAIYFDHHPASVIVIDDEKDICNLVAEMLQSQGYTVFSTTDPKEGMQLIENNEIDAVLTDLVMGRITGVEVLKKAKERHPDAVLILMTGQPTMENVITVLREGAYDYLIKPFTLKTLHTALQRGLMKQKLQRENIQLRELINLHSINEKIGSKIELKEILRTIVDTTKEEFGCDASAVLLKEIDSNILEIKYSSSLPNNFIVEPLFADNPDFTSPLLHNFEKNPDRLKYYNYEKVSSHLCHPIYIQNKLSGQIHLIRLTNTKPFSGNNLAELSLICSKASAAIENAYLVKNLEETYLATLSALANAIETRDQYTRGHTERVFKAAEAMAVEMGWDEEKIKVLRMGGLLHDIGKIGVPDAILNKPGPLTKEEFDIMKSHPLLGAKIVTGIPFLQPALPYILYHHERYDGKGYPHGLSGQDIPIEGRILAIVDTIDAITSDRPYRKGKDMEVALEELRIHSGTQFDPEIVEIFLRILPKFDFKSIEEPQPVK
ncbi:MAG: response regulator [candidate division Zixibacteria bacterium]|nr:response regulator [candidate division Zixibacteria bacterium]